MNKLKNNFSPREYENYFLFFLRWTARILSAACLLILLLFIFGESVDLSKITGKQMVGLIFFPFGFMFGLIFAFWKELWGGAITVGSVASLYLIFGLLLNNSLRLGWWFGLLAIPGVLFLIYGILSKFTDFVAQADAET